jgi:hypothetical protein
MDDLTEIARRKERLIARGAAQRVAIAEEFYELRQPIEVVERALAVTRFLRAHPVVVAVVVAGLIVFRRRSVLGLLTRGLAAWRMWRAIAPWLDRVGPGLRRAGGPGGR